MELNTILNLLSLYNLSADELLLVYLSFISQREEGLGAGHGEYFAKWYSGGGQEKLRSLFESLKAKGIIKKDYNPESFNPSEVDFNKTFLKGFLKHSDELGKELWEAYPGYSILNGVRYNWKNICGKNSPFNSLEQFFFFYSKEISHNPEKHKKVMDILKWAIDNNQIRFGIREFVTSHKWDELEQLRKEGVQGEVAESFDVYESV